MNLNLKILVNKIVIYYGFLSINLFIHEILCILKFVVKFVSLRLSRNMHMFYEYDNYNFI